MEQKLELGRRVLQLSETTLEGLEHVRQRAAKGYFKETFSLFYDVVSSFHEMEKVVYSMSPELKENALEERAVEVSEAMKLVLSAYEGYNELRPLEILQFTLLPRYRDWQRELREALEPLIVS